MAEKKEKRRRNNPDRALKKLVSHNDCFCDIVNFFLPEGERITPSMLQDFSENLYYHKGQELKKVERDVLKTVKGIGAMRILIGVENQCYEDRRFPIRLMTYDALSYYQFYQEQTGSPDAAVPIVFSVVFNFSSVPLNGKAVSSLWPKDAPEWAKMLGADYVVHSIDVRMLGEEEMERLGNGTIRQLVNLIHGESWHDMRLPDSQLNDLSEVLVELTGKDLSLMIEESDEGGEFMMEMSPQAIQLGRALRFYREKGLAEGRAEGKAEGIAKGKAEGIAVGRAEGKAEGLIEGMTEGRTQIRTILRLSREGKTPNEIASETKIEEKEVREILKDCLGL